MAAINLDDVLSTIYVKLHGDAALTAIVNSIDKGPDRRNGYVNPAATVSILTAPIGEGSNMIRGSLIVNIYANDVATGQADSKTLGDASARVMDLLHEAKLSRAGLRWHWIRAEAPLSPMKSDVDGEHLASIRFMYAVSTTV